MKNREFLFISGRQLKSLFLLRYSNREYVTINLDLSTTEKQYRVYMKREGVLFHHFQVLLPWDMVKKYSKKPELLYIINEQGVQPLLFFKDKVYRILDTIPPSLELDGIRMHTHKVFEDIRRKIECLGIKEGSLVLDTATGLGYTAMESSKKGARVITVEKDPFVIELARINPYSQKLFTSKNINIIIGDISQLNFREEMFDYIIHDPPRLTKSSGLLYSDEIYQKFYSILKPNGWLYHYIGNPGKKYRNRDLIHRVTQRLANIGFSTKVVTEVEGIIAKKSIYWI